MLIKNPTFPEFFYDYYIDHFGHNLGIIAILSLSFLFFWVMIFMLGYIILKEKQLEKKLKESKNAENRKNLSNFLTDKKLVIKLFNTCSPFPCMSLAFIVCTTFGFLTSRINAEVLDPQSFLQNIQLSKDNHCNDAINFLFDAHKNNEYISSYFYKIYLDKNQVCFENSIDKNNLVNTQVKVNPDAQKWLEDTILQLQKAQNPSTFIYSEMQEPPKM